MKSWVSWFGFGVIVVRFWPHQCTHKACIIFQEATVLLHLCRLNDSAPWSKFHSSCIIKRDAFLFLLVNHFNFQAFPGSFIQSTLLFQLLSWWTVKPVYSLKRHCTHIRFLTSGAGTDSVSVNSQGILLMPCTFIPHRLFFPSARVSLYNTRHLRSILDRARSYCCDFCI